MDRVYNYEILKEIKDRWSRRALADDVIKEEINALLEAARYAPSCYNEQPWRFVISDSESKRNIIENALTEGNREWAFKASHLILVVNKKEFSHNGKINKWAEFDTGIAVGYLMLEAERRGLIAHPMGGFSKDRLADLKLDWEEYSPIVILAIGSKGDVNSLSKENQNRENPGLRNDLKKLILKR